MGLNSQKSMTNHLTSRSNQLEETRLAVTVVELLHHLSSCVGILFYSISCSPLCLSRSLAS